MSKARSNLVGHFGYGSGVRSVTIDLDAASAGQLVEAASAVVLELAARPEVDSPAACMELAEDLGRVLDVGEAALARFVGVVDRGGEVRRWGFSSTYRARSTARRRPPTRRTMTTDPKRIMLNEPTGRVSTGPDRPCANG
jgi:hypothetical protein